ncbi:MAG: hypothetical protein R2698_03970 [Microthrixaceae bacterium]
MTGRRAAVWVLTAAAFVGALCLATVDLHVRTNNCGSALLSTGPAKPVVSTGDPDDDAFTVDRLRADCAHRLLGQRLLVAGPLLVGLAGLWLGDRLRDRSQSSVSGDRRAQR